jgi:hypothetical protein
MEKIIKDFMGNELKIGDNVVISDRTYSKTDYLIYGKITKIDICFYKNGKFNDALITIKEYGNSQHYLEELEMNNYKHGPRWVFEEREFDYNNKSFVNILKVG